MSDLIERQAVIDAIFSEPLYESGMKKRDADAVVPAIYEKIKSLPSTETHDKRTETHACDCISRQGAIDVEGLDEQIRCEMCRNPMHTNRGCDGNCKYDEKLYERIMQILGERIKPLPSVQSDIIHCKDCKHWREGTVFSFCDKLHRMGVLDALDYKTAEDDYCSMAERRTDGKIIPE